MSKLANIKNDFTQWYQDVILQAELIDSSPTKGCYVLRPYGYSLWENIQKIIDKKIKQTGTQNAYFPLLIPESFLKKEAKHIEGFSPELAVVTHAGGKKLEEPLIVRPTSETIIYYMFSRWIKSWRDLPLKVNQWANVVRWEKRPRAFLRSIEFLWQEGHTAHISQKEATKMAKTALSLYKDFVENYLAIPVVSGIKSENERFAGADATYTLEVMMQDAKALQMCTSHVLSHSFSSAFDIKFQDEDGKVKSPYCSSWGITSRVIGAMVMVHGDQNGLIIPPKIAPIQVVIIPIYRTEDEKIKVLDKANYIKDNLFNSNIRVVIDDDDQKTPGAKFYSWELKGVPIRIEIGPKDIEKNHFVLVNRAENDKSKKKTFVEFDQVNKKIEWLLVKIQEQLFIDAKNKLKENWHKADKLENFGPKLEENNGFYQTGWCGSLECEEELKSFKGSIRCLLEERKDLDYCFSCSKSSKTDVLVAKAY
ncbi:proline--tRNA ligase [Candidatus Dependentiae bacterium]